MSISRLFLAVAAIVWAAFFLIGAAFAEDDSADEAEVIAEEPEAAEESVSDSGSGGSDYSSSFPSFYYSGSNKSQYTEDRKSGKNKFENEFVLNMGYGDFSGFFRVSNDLSFPNKSKRTELEKVTLQWNAPYFDLTVGNFSTLFGNGLTLNVFEAPEIDYDTELMGAMINVPVGDSGNIRVLKGNFKAPYMFTADEVQGADIEYRLTDSVQLGASYVETESWKGQTDGTQKTDIIGVRGNFDFENFHFGGEYAEYDQNLEGASYNDGTGWIFSTGWHRNGLSLYGGYYEYKHIKSNYAVPAIFKEHPEKGGVDGTDEIGYGGKVSFSDDRAGTFDFNYAQSNRENKGFPYTEALLTWKPPSMVKDSFVIENRYIYELPGKENNTLVEWQHVISNDWTSTVGLEYSYLKSSIGSHDEHLASFAFDYLRQFTMIYKYELANFNYDTVNRWDMLIFRYQAPGYNYDLQLKYGGQRGGFSCAGGVCEFLPEFKGIEMTCNLYF